MYCQNNDKPKQVKPNEGDEKKEETMVSINN